MKCKLFLANTTCVLKAVKKKVLGFAVEIQEVPYNLVKTEGNLMKIVFLNNYIHF